MDLWNTLRSLHQENMMSRVKHNHFHSCRWSWGENLIGTHGIMPCCNIPIELESTWLVCRVSFTSLQKELAYTFLAWSGHVKTPWWASSQHAPIDGVASPSNVFPQTTCIHWTLVYILIGFAGWWIDDNVRLAFGISWASFAKTALLSWPACRSWAGDGARGK